MAKPILESVNIRLEYISLSDAFSEMDASRLEQQYGFHADEHKTSLMLHNTRQVIDMSQAVDNGAEGETHLSRQRGKIWSASGVYGQATLASAEKGKIVADALVRCALR